MQIDTWPGESLAFHDNLYIAGNSIRPFDVIKTTRTNLEMFDNVYFFAEEPLAFFWNEQVYTTIDEWRADTGLDGNSQFFIGPFRARRRQRRCAQAGTDPAAGDVPQVAPSHQRAGVTPPLACITEAEAPMIAPCIAVCRSKTADGISAAVSVMRP